MVVVAPLGAGLGVATRPGGDIHREHQRVGGWQAADQQVAQPLDLDAAVGQGSIDATPTTPADRLQAQMRQRQQRRWAAQQRVAQLEQRISTAAEAGV